VKYVLKKCHAGHDTIYKGYLSASFCDCGPSGKCNAMEIKKKEEKKEIKEEKKEKSNENVETKIKRLFKELESISLEELSEKGLDEMSIKCDVVLTAMKNKMEKEKQRRSKKENEGDDECVICMAEKRSAVFVPCGHHVTCMSCSAMIKQCPLCRQTIEKTIKLFK